LGFIIGMAVLLIATAFAPGFYRSIPVGLAVALTLFCSYNQVGTGQIGVEKVFGETRESQMLAGAHFVAPWKEVVLHEGLPQSFEYDGDVVASDGNPLKVTVGFTTILNPVLAWKVQLLVGEGYYAQVIGAGQTATRRGIAKFTWEAAATSARSAVENAIHTEFKTAIESQFVAAGFTKEEASLILTIAPVQLRSSLPDRKVLNSVAEKTAADQDLQRQATLNQIADQEAIRRGTDGEGIRKLFDNLPEGRTADDIVKVLGSVANKTRADAMLKAVESGQIDTIIMNGDSVSGGVSASLPSAASKVAAADSGQ
jgi:regulator of protease activity HflC (stomatin/prohibitin superfamily)